MRNSRTQIVATIGPASNNKEVFKAMMNNGLDVIRLNFSWGDLDTRKITIRLVREAQVECMCSIPIIIDLPGPRIQKEDGHTYDDKAVSVITEDDKRFIKFAIEEGVEYVAVSFVASAKDIVECREIIKNFNGNQKVIAKIERNIALENLEEIIAVSDAVMVARGDLGDDIPIEKVPFAQDRIIKACKLAGKPVIVATEVLLSMTENPKPTRAEVTDVVNAVLRGADALMLSEETAVGKYPVEAVATMEKVILESETHLKEGAVFNSL